jgi:hypothetical protein
MPYIILPSRRRAPVGRLQLRPEVAQRLHVALDMRSPAHARELVSNKIVTQGSFTNTTEQGIFGQRSRFRGNNVNSYWSVPITAIGTGEFTILFGDVRYNAYAVDSLQGYCCDFNSQAGGAPALTHSANQTSLCWYDGGSVNNTGVTAPGGNVNSVAWRRVTGTNYITAALGTTIGSPLFAHAANMDGTTWNVGGFKALATAGLHPNWSVGFALLARTWLDDEFLRDVGVAPYGAVFVADARRVYFGTGGGAAVVTGTASITPSPQTLTGASAVTVAGTLNKTPSAQTATAVGTVAVAGTFNKTPAAQTLTASGTVASGVTGTANITPAAQTVTASGTVAIAATATITPSAQTVTAAGAVPVAATATITPAAQTLTATGTIVSGVVGNASITPAAQTATASGTVAVAATATVTPAAQTVSATAAVSGGAVTGTANIFVSAQTLVAAANIIVIGTANITPAPQTLLGLEAGTLPDEIPESSRTLAQMTVRIGSERVDADPARLGLDTVHRNRPRLG